jgi:hypothetical protein
MVMAPKLGRQSMLEEFYLMKFPSWLLPITQSPSQVVIHSPIGDRNTTKFHHPINAGNTDFGVCHLVDNLVGTV